ncbi:thioredoxin family protein [Paracrocinitomix mangrovi]|uniref:thioredoxin family protein n=1 Tax=Paracrocinitomix mangrovi TaxID=2862509 RepID=UPI001C8EF285|nr:thioredoxin fold domain-containing protein [Paracrocinitomix mangrovi]UKN03622.1 thioredoxin family protein [Paracrocinitomix mangrovi]
MKRAIVVSFLALVGVVTLSFQSNTAKVQDDKEKEKLTWYTDLGEADKVSDETGKPIFGFFTGSDWCGWCIKLQNNVFAKEAFIKWAKEEVVLLELDFPRRKQLPAEQAKQNRELQQAFKVTGYPTIWMFYADKDAVTNKYQLTAIGKLGYPSGPGVVAGKEEEKFLKDANKILEADAKTKANKK